MVVRTFRDARKQCRAVHDYTSCVHLAHKQDIWCTWCTSALQTMYLVIQHNQPLHPVALLMVKNEMPLHPVEARFICQGNCPDSHLVDPVVPHISGAQVCP